MRPRFWDSANQKRDHFPVTVFNSSIHKLRGTSKVAQILGPENGHVFETEGFEKCAQELPVRYHLVPVFALPVGGWNVCGCWGCSPFLGPFCGPRFLATVS